MSEKQRIKSKVFQKVNELKTDLQMLENGLRVVDTSKNSTLWMSHIRTDLGNLQTLLNEYHENDN